MAEIACCGFSGGSGFVHCIRRAAGVSRGYAGGSCANLYRFGFLRALVARSYPRLVLHSLGYTLKREMIDARVDPDVCRAILGHAPKDAHDRYDGPSLEFLAEEFGRMPPLF